MVFHQRFVVVVVVRLYLNVHIRIHETQRKTSIFNTTYAFRNSLQIFYSTFLPVEFVDECFVSFVVFSFVLLLSHKFTFSTKHRCGFNSL